MRRQLSIKKALAAVLAVCLIFAYFPMQASADDQAVEIKTQDEWTALESRIGPDNPWPAEITINANGEAITADTYIESSITLTAGTFTVNYNVEGDVNVSGGEFIYNGQGNPLSSVTVTGGKFTNNHKVSTAAVSGGEFVNTVGKTVSGLTLSDGKFTNEGVLDGSVTMTGGTLENSGAVGELALENGTFDMKSGTVGNITMSGGSLHNSTGAALTLNINGDAYTVGSGGTLNSVLFKPTDLHWNHSVKKAEAQWSDVAKSNHKVALYKDNQQIHSTAISIPEGMALGTFDFTEKILENGYGNYHFTVQQVAKGFVSSPVATSVTFQYKGPSGQNVTKDNYAWDPSTATLTIKTDAGCLDWQSDPDILGTLITDSSYDIVERVVIGPKVTNLPSGMLPCPKIKDVILQNGNVLSFAPGWIDPRLTGVVCYWYTTVNEFLGTTQQYQCLITGIEDGQTFIGRSPEQFTVYGIGSSSHAAGTYVQPRSWEISKSGGEPVSDGNFTTESEENAYSVDSTAMKLGFDDYGTYTLTVYYLPERSNNTDAEETAVTFSIVPEGGGNSDPIYPPVQQYAITSSADQGGTITPEGRNTVYAGGSASYKITAAEGYVLKDVLVDDKSMGTLAEYTFERVYADHTIHAVFEKEEEPDVPEKPERPDNPNDPDNPKDPGKPDKPDKPGGKTEPAANEKQSKSPKTGDESQLLLYILLAGAAGGTVTAVIRRRKTIDR